MSKSDNKVELIRDPITFGHVNRRELLKIAPLLLAGTIVFPKVRNSLLSDGMTFTDWASAKRFRQERGLSAYSNSELTSLEKFPLNSYDADDPGLDLNAWLLKVDGLVQHSGDYSLSKIQSLPKITQNTRHICVEGWDVIGNFAGVRISDFLNPWAQI